MMVLMVFPIVIERGISISNLLRNRRSASFSATSVLPSLPPRPSLRSLPLNLGRTLITARNSPAQKHGCEACHRVRRKRCPGLQVCAAFQVERMGERQETCTLLRRMIVANLFMSSCNYQWVASIDMAASDEANENVIVKMSESFTDQAAQVS